MKSIKNYFIRFTIVIILFSLGQMIASAQDLITITNLVSFNGTNGQQPSGQLLQASDGNFYGTTLYGGTNVAYAGTVFKLTPTGVFTNLASFNITNGSNPNSGLIQDSTSSLFGTTVYGGAFTNTDPTHNGFGTIFRITTNGNLNLISSFDGHTGRSPNALLEIGSGVLYGSANSGGAFSNFARIGYGTVFKADTNGFLTNILSFDDGNGASPSAGLTVASNGVLFGTTVSGGTYEYGTAFMLAADGSVAAQYIFDFTNGAVPGALIKGRDGNFYGTTIFGGSNGVGTIFKLTTNLEHTTIANFDGTNGNAPASLFQSTNGNFYGVTSQGGVHGFGAVFELTTNGDLIPLYHFTGGNDGYSGVSLIQGKDGNFYGSTAYGGTDGLGNIFKLTIIPAPTIQTFSRNGNSFILNWASVSNQTYQVQILTNLALTNWSTLKIVLATNSLSTVTDTVGSASQRFYRIALPKP